MEYLFKITYDFLKFLEKLTGFSYNEINIIIWFFIIPFTWMILLDKIFSKHYYKIGFGIISTFILLLINDFRTFSNWLFFLSVDFLNLFNSTGSTYMLSSVIICLFLPIGIYVFLIRKAYFRKKK